MKPASQIAGFWNWLPAFRAVAEVEHIGNAAESLGLSSPAVSRTIGLLEEEIGVDLVERSGRGIKLTPHGQRLQSAVRDAMRTIHEATSKMRSEVFVGALKIASTSPSTELLLHPALKRLALKHPDLKVELSTLPLRGVRNALLRGELDVALVRSDLKADGISVQRLGQLPVRVYAPPCLSLPPRKRHSLESLSSLPFVVISEKHGLDPFPRSVRRSEVLRVETFNDAKRAAVELRALTVLPQLSRESAESAGLVEVQTPALRPLSLCVAWRSKLKIQTPADAFVECLEHL